MCTSKGEFTISNINIYHLPVIFSLSVQDFYLVNCYRTQILIQIDATLEYEKVRDLIAISPQPSPS